MVSERRSMMPSNLDCFLLCTTPSVKPQFLSKSEIRNLNKLWNPWERDTKEYFLLGDLWNRYDEWSAYGAGVPVRLKKNETLIQYYVPYLSAIQIFTSNSSVTTLREETELGESETSDSSSYESDIGEKPWRWDCCSSEEGGSEHDNTPWHANDKLGYLYVSYFESSPPCGRVPLKDKIDELSHPYPGLKCLRSVDLSPASWMAVAWYPIYHIPTGRTIKELSTCFLTYHTLSSSFQEMEMDDDSESPNSKMKRKGAASIAVPAFGLVTYKLQGHVWDSGNSGKDKERVVSLLSIADSWLKQLRAQHHDFDYFTGRQRF